MIFRSVAEQNIQQLVYNDEKRLDISLISNFLDSFSGYWWFLGESPWGGRLCFYTIPI